MSKGEVIILGVNGHIGRAVAEAFVSAGWTVSGMARTDKHHIPGVRFIEGDSDSVADMRRAIGDIDVVVNALNLPYHTWFNGRMEAQMGRVIEALGSTGKTVLFPGNIYNFAASDRAITPDLPQHPEKERGAIRVSVEQMFEAAAKRGDIQTIILRAGDFYGPGAQMDWFDQVMMREAKAGKVSVIGVRGAGRSWAYLPDLARAFEALACLRTQLSGFENFHFAGNFVTPEQMSAAIARVAPAGTRFGRFPLWLLKVLGLIDPIVREIAKMDYLWRNPMELKDERLDALLGPDFATPFDVAVAKTVTPFFDAVAEMPKGAALIA